ncbi:Do family serine endopeptidase [Permianibacter aggregans]|uniref:Peptidase Do n=1 Tax=Permianibacter aggregans TaxID=1510150 RepID=A0A4R6UKR1_9GAMM|nr:Do family serine endopeptidase [Permianibacter aggregans]QGX39270.1 Do family serine endopeptidase [Permianibacter aggregans]TDQ46079.1 peptidase Do [Permianibacter aggregans]
MPAKFAPLLLICSLLLPLPATSAALPSEVDGQPLPSLAPMLEKISPGIVNIATTATVDRGVARDFFGFRYRLPPRKVNSLGSGVIVDAEKGLILTNHHVVGVADEITVTLFDNRELKATVVGSDKESDIAVLKVEAKNLIAVPMSDSDKLRVGDFVVAIGNPFSLGHTVTSGIVSALGRQGLGIEQYEDFIQTDAAINPGNSGGALVNLRGELVGINTAIVSPGGTGNIGIGFAIPINQAWNVLQQIMQFGEVRRGALGLSVNDMTRELAEALGVAQSSGVIVTTVSEGLPADKAGIKPYDIIVALNGRAIRNRGDWTNQLGLQPSESWVTVELLRDGKRMNIRAKLSASAIERIAGESIHPLLEGITLRNYLRRGEPAGVEITELQPRSRAAQYGLRSGDVLIGLGRYRVEDIGALKELAKGQRALPINVLRDDNTYLLVLK